MEIVSATALISINETFFIQLISFLIFLYILNRVMIRPLLGTMEQRKGYLAGVKTEIEESKSAIENLNRELDRQRAQVLKEADAAVGKLVKEADHSASEVVASARAQIAQLRLETENKVKAQLSTARAQLTGEVEAVTTTIMEKVLQRRLQS